MQKCENILLIPQILKAHTCVCDKIGSDAHGKVKGQTAQHWTNTVEGPPCRSRSLTTGDHTEALRQLADDVYHASLAFGTDDVRTSGGYFHMANVFFKLGDADTANSLYDKVRETQSEVLNNQHKNNFVRFMRERIESCFHVWLKLLEWGETFVDSRFIATGLTFGALGTKLYLFSLYHRDLTCHR